LDPYNAADLKHQRIKMRELWAQKIFKSVWQFLKISRKECGRKDFKRVRLAFTLQKPGKSLKRLKKALN
jgi:hypothetical protein